MRSYGEETADSGSSRYTLLDDQIAQKQATTQDWVEDTYGKDHHAVVLGPDVLLGSHAARSFAAQTIANVLHEVYGDDYPLPESNTPAYTLHAMGVTALQPYVGVVAPKWLTAEAVRQQPALLDVHQSSITPVAVTARVRNVTSGSQEAGRTGKRPKHFRKFHAGWLVLETIRDWHDEGEDGSYMLHADVRAAADHVAPDGQPIPTSGATQTLYVGEGGLRATFSAPLYRVGDVEPFVAAKKYRENTWVEHLNDYTVHTPAGPHVALLQELCKHQTGRDLRKMVVTASHPAQTLHMGVPQQNGPTIYTKLNVVHDGGEAMTAREARALFDRMGNDAPLVLVEVPADTPESAGVQALLMEAGFTVCGFEPAHDEPTEHGHRSHVVPPKVYLARLGDSVTSGQAKLAPAYFPPEIYGRHLQKQLARVDNEFRNSLKSSTKHDH